MKRFSLFSCLLLIAASLSAPCRAVDSIYIGGQVGLVALSGDVATHFNNNIGFGGDLGFRTNSLIDLNLSFQTSSHSGLNLYALPISADVHVGQLYDLDFTLGAGPGFYFWKPGTATTDTKFGLNFGGAVDLIVADHIKVGMGARYHAIFGGTQTAGSYATVMMRLGYMFDLE